MKTLSFIFSLVTLTTALSWARPVPEALTAGHYTFKDYTVLMKKRYEVVYGFSTAGALKLKELIAKNYICENTGREIYLCSIFQKTTDAADKIDHIVQRKLSGKTLQISEARGPVELYNEGEALVEWRVPQAVVFGQKLYPEYRILETDSMKKAFMGDPAEETFILNNTEIYYSLTFIVETSREEYFSYLISARYK